MNSRPSFVSLVWQRRRIGAILTLLMLAGCNDAEHKKQLEEVRSQAEKRVAQIETQSKERVSVLEKQIETLKAEAETVAAKAKAEADEAVSKAQASADDAEKETAKALNKAKEAYKNEGKARYASLNKDLAAVTAKSGKVSAKAKAAYDKTIKDILALQKEISKDIAAYDQATLDTFGKTKAKLDIDLTKYKALIKSAKTKVPA
jgi:hypothetical protein